MRTILKRVFRGASAIIVFPWALLCGFGAVSSVFVFWAQVVALVPGLPGDYLRAAYYRLTVEKYGEGSRISFGAFFAHPQVRIGRSVYIGSYSVIGRTSIGDRTQIASGVQILSGRRQHERGSEGQILSADHDAFETVEIGADCWIGAGAIIAADVGHGTTIGAGTIVIAPIPAGVVAVGNPARVLRSSGQPAA